ncbi:MULTISPECIES: FHA domain-containing protein [unclassified Acinetobacter]|uniref:FHA domain-containing protein n=1 Tax=unclassified Acinetobacter TaxID=196816 RepID=UPI0029341344|nr:MULTISPECIES: FHA domain-containing protein [unclassified Acinetobacter]WOE30642.1 FHA domain-containing protein [Acinetobacter sp. SAAs470]WOE38834.1 FHA domain-containing protein [Acinetobacter sp. SAAs474]
MTWTLQAITDELAGQQILIQHDMLVGRHQSADLILQSAEISRKHAALLLKDDVLSVQDLGSSNGTFVNDQRINTETILNHGDMVQFASLKFSVLSNVNPQQEAAVAEQLVTAEVASPPSSVDVVAVVQPEDQATSVIEKNPAQQMNDQGMPELKERDHSVQLNRDGMPQGVAVPKPAPIPEGIDIHAVPSVAEPAAVEPVADHAEQQQKEVQKNASIGLISLVVLIIVAIIAWVLFQQ